MEDRKVILLKATYELLKKCIERNQERLQNEGPYVKDVKSWDAMPPVVYDGEEAFNTRPLEYDYRKMLDILRSIQAHYSGSLDHMPYYVKEAFEFLAKLDGLDQPR